MVRRQAFLIYKKTFVLCKCHPTIGQRPFIYCVGAFCKPMFSEAARSRETILKVWRLSGTAFPPLSKHSSNALCFAHTLFRLIRMIAYRLFVTAGGHSSPACAGLLYLIEFKVIYGPGYCALSTQSLPEMLIHKTLSVALVVLWSALRVSCSHDPCPCTKPAVRREWRAFNTEEKAEWIRAVNVGIDSLFTSIVLLKRHS